jgi:hypothetical protein
MNGRQELLVPVSDPILGLVKRQNDTFSQSTPLPVERLWSVQGNICIVWTVICNNTHRDLNINRAQINSGREPFVSPMFTYSRHSIKITE